MIFLTIWSLFSTRENYSLFRLIPSQEENEILIINFQRKRRHTNLKIEFKFFYDFYSTIYFWTAIESISLFLARTCSIRTASKGYSIFNYFIQFFLLLIPSVEIALKKWSLRIRFTHIYTLAHQTLETNWSKWRHRLE